MTDMPDPAVEMEIAEILASGGSVGWTETVDIDGKRVEIARSLGGADQVDPLGSVVAGFIPTVPEPDAEQ